MHGEHFKPQTGSSAFERRIAMGLEDGAAQQAVQEVDLTEFEVDNPEDIEIVEEE